MGEMLDLAAVCEGIDYAGDILPGQLIVVCDLYALVREVTNTAINAYNALGLKTREKTMKHLHPMQVGMLMVALDNVIKISISDSTDAESLKLAVYQDYVLTRDTRVN